ncbi:MAG: alpha/beta hydrolase [Acetobacteraceae bacterium]|nr:alpha/beta hydrolase [Acetobacteraceae bacterium]
MMNPVSLLVSGSRIEGAWWSAGARPPPVVLLHEGLGSVSLWRDFPASLAAATGQAIFAYSRFGYGRSDPNPPPWPLDYMHREGLETLPAVLDQAGIGKCVLVGHSDGASIAAIAAGIGERSRYRGLVLIAPHFFVEDVALREIAEARGNYEQGGLRERLARHHADPDDCFYGWNRAWLNPAFRTSFDLTDELMHVRVPVLIVQGERDPYGTAAHAKLAEEVCTCPVQTVLIEAGHDPHLECPEQILEVIAGFIRHLVQAHEDAD